MEVRLTKRVQDTITALARGKRADPARLKKITKTISALGTDHRHPGLASHRYAKLDPFVGEKVWESYVENDTPSAWRIWWFFGPGADEITIIGLGPHP
jgi:hypothetical protein